MASIRQLKIAWVQEYIAGRIDKDTLFKRVPSLQTDNEMMRRIDERRRTPSAASVSDSKRQFYERHPGIVEWSCAIDLAYEQTKMNRKTLL